jgi:hypothetical protein
MADTSLFQQSALGRPVRDLLDTEVKESLSTLETQLNTDRSNLDIVLPVAAGKTGIYTDNQAVTDGTAFDLFTCPIADEQGVCIEVRVAGYIDDGTDHQMISLVFHVNAVNKGGTVTAVVTEALADVVAASSGTLTLAGAAAEGAANVLDVSVTLTSSLTSTTSQISWEARVIGASAAASKVLTAVNADA